MVGVGYLVDDEEDVANVKGDVAADVRIKYDVRHRAFPYSVKVQADKVTLGVDDRAAGVASGSVVCSDEADRNFSGCVSPLAIVLLRVYVTKGPMPSSARRLPILCVDCLPA